MVEHDKNTQQAWHRYWLDTRALRGERYEQVEPFAWASLQSKLGNLKVKRVRQHA